ncbi:hypothetical protein HXX76_007863 [Chlamydomonas incerta]|uniref:SBP-type domain-containing protein n=1 Tax=Chlamydomonas incerta TaxID=51695 RepID=A0A835T9M0_CHLIN|nr:hypothetical protein HXX76_007863 [Chlamydomonas incerta]|eukprot:KAG2434136.1 hypothetical protein HXX76_007863 [Chlamydomonas incerta]
MYGRTSGNDSGVSQHPTAQQLQQQGSGCGGMDYDGGVLVVDGADGPCNIDHAALATAPVYSPQPGGSKMACQVMGCGLSLAGMKGYFLRHRVCEEHSKAPVLIIGGAPSRLCQQCSKFHHVNAFEGAKRTCRVQLDRIRINKRARRTRKMNAAAAAAAAATGMDDGAGGMGMGMGSECPAPPASGLRGKRPADSSGSGEGSYPDSRKARHLGGPAGAGAMAAAAAAATAAAAAAAAFNAGGVRIAGGAPVTLVTPLALAQALSGCAPGGAMTGVGSPETDPLLPESGGSGSDGSREHPRASGGLSGQTGWRYGGQQSSMQPMSPATAMAGGGGSTALVAHSPASGMTGPESGAGAGGMHASLSAHVMQQYGGNPYSQAMVAVNGGVDAGGPGSIAAAAAAAGLTHQVSLPGGAAAAAQSGPMMFAARQHMAAAAAAAAAGHQQQRRMTPASGQDSAIASQGGAGSQQDAAASPWSLQVGSAADGAGGLPAVPSANNLHPLLQQEMLLQHHHHQHHQQPQLAAAAAAAWPSKPCSDPTVRGSLREHCSRDLQGSALSDVALATGCGGSGMGGSGGGSHLSHHVQTLTGAGAAAHLLASSPQEMLLIQQAMLKSSAPQGCNAPSLAGPSSGSDGVDPALVAMLNGSALPPALPGMPQTLAGCAATGGAGGGGRMLTASGAVISTMPSASAASGGARSANTLAGALGAAAAANTNSKQMAGSRRDGDALASGGNNAVQTVSDGGRLVRMSLENDDVILGPSDESGALLGSLMDLLTTQNVDLGVGSNNTNGGNGNGGNGNGTGVMPGANGSLVGLSGLSGLGMGSGGGVGGGSAAANAAAMAALTGGGIAAVNNNGAGGGGAAGINNGSAMVMGSNEMRLQSWGMSALGSGFSSGRGGQMLQGVPGFSHLGGAGAAGSNTGSLAALATGASGLQGAVDLAVAAAGGAAMSRATSAAANGGAGGAPGGGSAAAMAALSPPNMEALMALPPGSTNSTAGLGSLGIGRTLLLEQGLGSLGGLSALGGMSPLGGSNALMGSQLGGLSQLAGSHMAGLSQLGGSQEQLLAGLGSVGAGFAGSHQGSASGASAGSDLLLQRQLLHAQAQQQHQQQVQHQHQMQLLQQQQQALAQQQQLLHLQQAQAAALAANATAAAAPAVPAAGLLLSRLLDADTKTHHLSTELNGCLAEKQLLRRQLMLTLQSGQAPDADQVAAAAMAAAANGNAGSVNGMAPMPSGAPSAAAAAAAAGQAAAAAGLGSLAGLGVAPAVALGAARASPAAQLQALMDARSAATAGVPAAMATAAASPVLAAAAGAAPAAGSGGYAAPDLLTRVSLKIMNCLPDELPPDVRSRMQAFASQAPLDLVQGCLRPGCTEVVLDALHAGDEQALVAELLRQGDVDAAAAALLAALPQSLHCKDIYLQAADQAIYLRPGAAPKRASWAGVAMRRGGQRVAKPELLAAEAPVLHMDHLAMDGSRYVRLRVLGRHLDGAGVTVLARMGGLALAVTLTPVDVNGGGKPFAAAAPPSSVVVTEQEAESCPTGGRHEATAATPTASDATAPVAPPAQREASGISLSAASPSPPPAAGSPQPAAAAAAATAAGPAGAATYSLYDVEIEIPPAAPSQGLLILEPRAGVLLGGWAPVLLLEEAGAAAEAAAMLRGLDADAARRLVVSLGLFVDHGERCAAVLEAEEAEAEAEVCGVAEDLEAEEGGDEVGGDREERQDESMDEVQAGAEAEAPRAAGTRATSSCAHSVALAASPDGEPLAVAAAVNALEAAQAAIAAEIKAEAEAEEAEAEAEAGSPGAAGRPDWHAVFGPSHGRIVGMGRTLLAYSALRACPSLMSYLGSQLVEMGEPLSALPAAAYNGAPLLACATLAGGGAVLRIAAEWAARGGAMPDWRAQVPGQPVGATLLHLAVSLPPAAAVAALEVMWALALAGPAQPADADSFAAAWFSGQTAVDVAAAALSGCVLLDSPAVLFSAVSRAALAAATPATAGVALAAATAAETLDRLCIARLASSYIRTHNYTSPLDHVELPSMEANSCAAGSVGSGAGRRNGGAASSMDATSSPRQRCSREQHAEHAAAAAAGLHDLHDGVLPDFDGLDEDEREHAADAGDDEDAGAAAAAAAAAVMNSGSAERVRDLVTEDYAFARRSSRSSRQLLAESPGGGGMDDRSGHGSVGGVPAFLMSPTGVVPAAYSPSEVPAMATASPPRMRVVVAPKALAQSVAVAAAGGGGAAAAAAGGDGSSWNASGADASLVPPSNFTMASSGVCASGSMPAFGSCTTAAGMTMYGGSLGLSSYGIITANLPGGASMAALKGCGGDGGAAGSGAGVGADGAAAGGHRGAPLPMEPLLNMCRPLPSSPSSSQDPQHMLSNDALAVLPSSCVGVPALLKAVPQSSQPPQPAADRPSASAAMPVPAAPAAMPSTTMAASPSELWSNVVLCGSAPAAPIGLASAADGDASGHGSSVAHAAVHSSDGRGFPAPRRLNTLPTASGHGGSLMDRAMSAAAAAEMEAAVQAAAAAGGSRFPMRDLMKKFKSMFKRSPGAGGGGEADTSNHRS